MLSEIGGKRTARRRQEGAGDSLGREIMTDILITTAGAGLVILAVLLAAQDLSVN